MTVGTALVLGGCASLPSSGPTAGQIESAKGQAGNTIAFKIVDLPMPGDAPPGQGGAVAYGDGQSAGTIASLAQDGRNDLIGPGDVLSVTLFEVGTRLFAGGKPETPNPIDTSAQGQMLGDYTVQADGSIVMPYMGVIFVAGATVQDVQLAIRNRLSRMSQFPQPVVTIKQNVSNTVFVSGDVQKPGRYALSNTRERLLDVIAEAGGSRSQVFDTVVTLTRGGRSVSQRLSELRSGGPDNLVLNPGDRIELGRSALSYSVLGAAQKVAQVPFETARLSLAEAVARVGGPSDASADPSAIFLFRYEPQPAGSAAAPIVYRLNLMQPTSYLAAQQFMMRDKDVIYFANARASQPSKLALIINQIFTPIFMARQMTK